MLSILFNKKASTFQGVIEIELDATISESHRYASSVTAHAIEGGGVVADHIHNEPPTLDMEGLITDSPVRYLSGIRDLLSGSGTRSKTAFEELLQLRASKTPFKVVTGLKVYPDMVFTSLDFPRDRSTGMALRFSASLKQLRIVSSRSVAIPEDKIRDVQNAKDQGASSVDAGRQATTAAGAATTTKGSFLFNLFN